MTTEIKMGLLVLLFVFVGTVESLKIGAFNIQVFGQKKSSDPDVMAILGKILRRYDIVLISEIRDIKGTAIQRLLDITNSESTVPYSLVISDRVGRTSSKEQYAFFVRDTDSLSVVSSYHYDDGDESLQTDTFQREPFIVRFYSQDTVVSDFVLVAIHTQPDNAVAEIQALLEVQEDIVEKWKTENIIILGDLNADCSYVSNKTWESISLRQMDKFYWPLSDDVDTTVGQSDCAYDRFVISGYDLIENILPNSAQVFDFGQEYGLNQTQALKVSDHFPIEIELVDAARVGGASAVGACSSLTMFSVVFVLTRFTRV